MTRISSEDAIWRDVEKARFVFVFVGANAAAWLARQSMMEVGAKNFILGDNGERVDWLFDRKVFIKR